MNNKLPFFELCMVRSNLLGLMSASLKNMRRRKRIVSAASSSALHLLSPDLSHSVLAQHASSAYHP